MEVVDKSSVEYVDHMGDDLSIVNAARVSFSKRSMPTLTGDGVAEKDKKLIRYLARHNHWTPFAHTALSLRISAPIFVARQLVKHQVGLAWNEESRRYISHSPAIFIPSTWRKKAENVKQGSSDETVEWLDRKMRISKEVTDTCYRAWFTYKELLDAGVCEEQARMVLPLNAMTQWIWTGSVMAFARVVNLRNAPDAQKETKEVAVQIDKIAAQYFPHSWKELTE